MKKIITIFCILFLLFINCAYSQTKEETQDWISEKISYYSYSDDIEVFHDYSITFDKSNIILKDNFRAKIGGNDNSFVITFIIPIKDLHKIRFEAQQHNVWLHLKTKSNSIEYFVNNNSNKKIINKVEIILEKSFFENDMKNRMDKAFTNLIKLYGGFVGEEKF